MYGERVVGERVVQLYKQVRMGLSVLVLVSMYYTRKE